MRRARFVLVTVVAATLVTACSSGSDSSSSGGAATGSAAAERTTPSSSSGVATSSTPPATTVAPPPTTAAPIPSTAAPAPNVPPAPQPVVTVPPPSEARPTDCAAASASDPPDGVTGLQGTVADIDGDSAADAVWIYNALDGTHLHVRTAQGRSDDILLRYGQGAVSVGAGQVDLDVNNSERPGTKEEILAVTSDGDGRRLVGVYEYLVNTGCLNVFQFSGGNPFVYLVSRGAMRSGLHCVSDGVKGHLEAVTATPSGTSTYSTNRLVFGLDGRRLIPSTFVAGSLTLPADEAALAAGSDITGCRLSSPVF